MSRHTSGECVLCAMWDRIPYSKRHTTPVMPVEVEGVLIVGFWLKLREKEPLRLCERHMVSLERLDLQEQLIHEHLKIAAERIAKEKESEQAALERSEPFKQRAASIVHTVLHQQKPDPGVKQPPKPYAKPPGLPPIIGVQAPETTEHPKEIEAQQGARVQYPCMMCGKMAVTGEVHACS